MSAWRAAGVVTLADPICTADGLVKVVWSGNWTVLAAEDLDLEDGWIMRQGPPEKRWFLAAITRDPVERILVLIPSHQVVGLVTCGSAPLDCYDADRGARL